MPSNGSQWCCWETKRESAVVLRLTIFLILLTPVASAQSGKEYSDDRIPMSVAGMSIGFLWTDESPYTQWLEKYNHAVGEGNPPMNVNVTLIFKSQRVGGGFDFGYSGTLTGSHYPNRLNLGFVGAMSQRSGSF